MVEKKKVIAYFDGSNFYHNCKNNYGITSIKFDDLCNNMIDLSSEELVKIRYFNCPLNQQENPSAYAEQLKFFKNLRQTPFLELHLGKLVKRRLKKIDINCTICKHQKAEQIICPKCKKQMQIIDCYKSWEKGVDVQLATSMLIDALAKKYDIALLFSGDADFCPAIRYITKVVNKEIVYCCFPTPKTSELIQTCSRYKIVTQEIILKSIPNNHPQ